MNWKLFWQLRPPHTVPTTIIIVLTLLIAMTALTGCNVTLDRAPVVTVTPPEFYTRYEIDAINAENACRQMARTLLQAQRCTVRR